VSRLGLKWLHLDMMDGHFVPNLSFGPETLAALRRHGSTLFFDTHLMLSEPHLFVDALRQGRGKPDHDPHRARVRPRRGLPGDPGARVQGRDRAQPGNARGGDRALPRPRSTSSLS
jgi:hypothetical protein